MTHSNDQSRAISKAIARLQALEKETFAGSCNTAADQIESYGQARDLVLMAHEITADLLIHLAEIAAEWGNTEIGASAKCDIRCTDLITEALYETELWIEQYQEENKFRRAVG